MIWLSKTKQNKNKNWECSMKSVMVIFCVNLTKLREARITSMKNSPIKLKVHIALHDPLSSLIF